MYIVYKFFDIHGADYYWSGKLWISDIYRAKLYSRDEAKKLANLYLGHYKEI